MTSMFRGKRAIVAYVGFILAATKGYAQEDTYLELIKPVLKARCYACHGALKQEADLRLDTAATIKELTDNGHNLLERVASSDSDLRMPPEGAALTPVEIEAIKKWIAEGAPAPTNESPEQPPDEHWAFIPPQKSSLMTSRSPIDELIERDYVNLGIRSTRTPAKDATLLRRVYLDLIGLPPTPEKVRAFSEERIRYEEVVDELLSSPQFGQRWARHWMDIWRYSDWYGRRQQNDVRNSDPQIWRWRDWIVDSLNEDKSYAVMIQQMLAADELYPHDEDAWPATGYLIRSYYSLNPNEWMRHNAEYTGKAFLGLTFNCAHCHDHKYDPIAHDDYFRLRAFFEPIGIRSDQFRGEMRPPDFQPYSYGGSRTAIKVGLVRVFDEQPDRPTYFYSGGDERNVDKDRGSLQPGVPRFLEHLLPPIERVEIPVISWYSGLRDSVREYELNDAKSRLSEAKLALESVSARPPVDKTPLQATLDEANLHYEQLVDKAREDGAVSALGGSKSLYLNAGQGRRIFQHDLEQLKSVKDGTTIEFELQIVKDQHVNFQLAYDTRQNKTATYIAFDKGAIRSYIPGGYGTLPVGYYNHAEGEVRFHVQFILHPDDDTTSITVTIKNKAGDVLRTLPEVTAALNGWNCTENDFQPITLDCRANTVAIYDDIRVHTPGEPPLLFDFEHAEFLPGEDPIAVQGWRLVLADKDSNSSILNVLPTDEILAAIKTLKSARQSLELADLPWMAAEARHEAAEAQLEALKSLLAADKARYQVDAPVAQDELDSIIHGVATKQREAESLMANADLLEAQLHLQKAEAMASDNSMRMAEIDAANKEIEAAKIAVSEAASRKDSDVEDYKHLSSFAPKVSSGRRAALAKMITDRQNPLTARVAVNHIWTRHFQTPLVSSSADFGRNGSLPIFPALLDHLAVQLMDSRWSLKDLHRAIVLSDTYRQSSQQQEGNDKVAPELLVSFPHKRMESEMVRDSILAIAGTLDDSPATNPLDNNEALTTRKRSLYYESFPEDGGSNALGKLFDSPSPTECYRRTTTIVPQQALVLSNSDFIHEAVSQLYQRIEQNPKADNDDKYIEAAFVFVLGRYPNEREIALAAEFLSAEGDRVALRQALIRVLFNHNDFVTIR